MLLSIAVDLSKALPQRRRIPPQQLALISAVDPLVWKVMRKTVDLGRRIELCSMDCHCHDIAIGLYEQERDGGPRFLVHTYSALPDASERAGFLRSALQRVGGLVPCTDAPECLRFECAGAHTRALKRMFLDLCKRESSDTLDPKPLTAFDKKADGELTACKLGGAYDIVSEDGSEAGQKRAVAVAKGFAKLCEMNWSEEEPTRVSFNCGLDHDGLIGFLMFRAQNVRAAMKDGELAASRGVLAAPSQQK